MYDELVKRLREMSEWSNIKWEDYSDDVQETIRQAADAIEELLPFKKQVEKGMRLLNKADELLNAIKSRWIPVTERLPKKKCEIYWVCTDSGYQCECRWTNNKYGLGESDNWGWHIMDKPQYQKVIAWRELPEPYEPPKED